MGHIGTQKLCDAILLKAILTERRTLRGCVDKKSFRYTKRNVKIDRKERSVGKRSEIKIAGRSRSLGPLHCGSRSKVRGGFGQCPSSASLYNAVDIRGGVGENRIGMAVGTSRGHKTPLQEKKYHRRGDLT